MYKATRLNLLLTSTVRAVVVGTAKAARGVLQSDQVHNLVYTTAKRRSPWAPRKQRPVTCQLPAVHRG
jgi:hypothetical protein